MVKLAEVVAKFIAQQGVDHVFGVSGGASLHLIHGIAETTQVKFIPTAHEAGAGFAADAYARLRGLGVAVATSGPGATNLVTSIAAAYYDSVPILFLTGNVATFRFGAPLGVRQYGFQETPIVDMVRPVAKYAVCVTDPKRILYELTKAVSIAQDGRQGPVLVDIPDDVQRAEVDYGALQRFKPWAPMPPTPSVERVLTALQVASRPLFVWGAGMRPYASDARLLAARMGVPVACTWGAIDLMDASDPLMAGGFGTHGNRGANFAVQNADLIISIGCRLDTKATGFPAHFARGAKIAMVDIDGAEIDKFRKLGRKIDIDIRADAGAFVVEMLRRTEDVKAFPDRSEWQARVGAWKSRYPSRDDPSWKGTKPYALVRRLAESIGKDDIIVSDTGTALGYLMQAYPFKGERFIHAFNATPMGYGLPAAIGAACATGRKVVLVTGDGSALMSLGEFATLSRHHAGRVRVVLLNNRGHAMCRQTQRQWLGGRYPATSIEGGLGFPNFKVLAKAFGIEIEEYDIDPDAQLVPQAKFGQPLEDADPPLPREEFIEQMIVPPLKGDYGPGIHNRSS